jgi:hypothetical protein
MIAHRTHRAVSFLAARVKSRLLFAAPTGRKARRALAPGVPAAGPANKRCVTAPGL